MTHRYIQSEIVSSHELGGEGDSSVCRAGAEERSKGAAREITANRQDRRTDLEVCRAWLSAVLYSSDGPLSQDESLE
jgi:hypothetical protein